MFVAKKENGQFVSLLDNWSREELIKLRTEHFYCTACQLPVHLKVGTNRISHFAHKKDASCSVKTEHESSYHMEGKKQLYNWLQHQTKVLELEPYIKAIQQRPDILLELENQKIAIEFQCSQLDPDLFNKRTKAYRRSNINPIWILGETWLKQKENKLLTISPFQWLFTSVGPRGNMPQRILYFKPSSSQLVLISNLLPFTTTETIAQIKYHSLTKITLKEILHSQVPFHYESTLAWLKLKKKWRYQISTYPSKKLNPLFIELYENRIPRTTIPAVAGLPFKSLYLIETPAVIWQLWVLLDSIIPINIGQSFTFNEVYKRFNMRIMQGNIKVRKLPLIEKVHYSFALMDYLQLLTGLTILKRVDKLHFVKINEIKIPESLNQAQNQDISVMNLLYTSLLNGKASLE
ncbi:competence protein CoiA family protein [Cytobacillus sp. S13-E01]|uniref:competence protein CoiA n=1 Tax=Cytobacillus sp. S13-E01 TaxID=3031326 RepID=UPI0023D7C225|nr:competence protein CoiA family protein [Cytobacillus sp. S13-E01]MDF0727928.1 competence protein CoiA family protein [Cytobacillus sp. S13-E01]